MAIAPISPATKKDAATAMERKRIPMSTPVQKLEVPDIPGYHLHWFRSWELGRIDWAQRGGYEFVYDEEVRVNSVGLGSDTTKSGNTDMGSQVSIVSPGSMDGSGQPGRLILMKIKQEYWEEDNKARDDRSAQFVETVTGGMVGAQQDKGPNDTQNRYVDKARTALPEFFKRKQPRP